MIGFKIIVHYNNSFHNNMNNLELCFEDKYLAVIQ